MIVGYRRQSTIEQEAGYDAQGETLTKAGCERIFGEKVSSVAERAELLRALEFVREGDSFVVTALSRLARSLKHLMEIVEELERKKVTLRILDMNIDTSTPTGRLMLGLMGSIFQFEREIMLERQRVGIAAARSQKKYKGRKPIIPTLLEQFQGLSAQGFTHTQIARQCKCSRQTVWRALRDG